MTVRPNSLKATLTFNQTKGFFSQRHPFHILETSPFPFLTGLFLLSLLLPLTFSLHGVDLFDLPRADPIDANFFSFFPPLFFIVLSLLCLSFFLSLLFSLFSSWLYILFLSLLCVFFLPPATFFTSAVGPVLISVKRKISYLRVRIRSLRSTFHALLTKVTPNPVLLDYYLNVVLPPAKKAAEEAVPQASGYSWLPYVGLGVGIGIGLFLTGGAAAAGSGGAAGLSGLAGSAGSGLLVIVKATTPLPLVLKTAVLVSGVYFFWTTPVPGDEVIVNARTFARLMRESGMPEHCYNLFLKAGGIPDPTAIPKGAWLTFRMDAESIIISPYDSLTTFWEGMTPNFTPDTQRRLMWISMKLLKIAPPADQLPAPTIHSVEL